MHHPNRSPRAVVLLFLGLTLSSSLTDAQATAQYGTDENPPCEGGAGSLLISPKRVIFSARDRSAEIQLMNNGCEPTTYRLELIEMAMDGGGRLHELDAASDRSLGRMVRYAPRQVRIAPGERQTVRMFLRRPADLESGEYRSHLRLRAIPDATTGSLAAEASAAAEGFSLRLIALPGIAIPIIVRHGRLAAEIGLSRLGLATGSGTPRASVRLERTGQRSVYGDLTAEILPAAGDAVPVGVAKGIAVYGDIPSRTVSVPLQLPAGMALPAGRLRLTFRSRPDVDGGGDPLTASSEITLP